MTTPDNESPERRGPRHRRRSTIKERLTRTLPIVGILLAAAIVIISLIHHRHLGSATPPATSSSTSSTVAVNVSSSSASQTVPTSSTVATTTTIATPTTVPPGEVLVDIYNGSGAKGVAAAAAVGLKGVGFPVNSTQDAPSFTYTTNIIEYTPGELMDADTLLAHINGTTRLVANSSIAVGDVHLIIGSSFVGVTK